MSVISDYLSKLKRQYPNTQAISEQLEELRDTLHIKTEEYQSQGFNYNDAAQAAINSLGDITPLLDEVSGHVKSVYINRLNRNNAVYCTLIILAEFLMAWLGYSLATSMSVPVEYFSISLLALILGLGIWIIIAVIEFRRNPSKMSVIEMPFKKLIFLSVLGWLSVSVVLVAANSVMGAPYWFPLPVIGISAWPVNIVLFHRQLTCGRYDAA